ncbi:DNA phosphorothioation-dependent restriction protein DptF [Desertivirga xinjiangensis]|uniref:DNA phosphorothioation-dependent restriction protein DptF n=1 Tax=Desertivirga xinjiangensis TaxID=539206 RepID=UPI00210A09C9|nr:DNA phosphorothioation-dependent restriction protein DptF [Pedobacter xinjiangensis]
MFKELLDKLSISSREAVVDGTHNSFDDFKNYLHVDRPVDLVLESIVISSVKSEQPRLILISGNVGDGKSHMLAKLFNKYADLMGSVLVRNDATESNYVSKSWIEELEDFLKPFSDDALQMKNSSKVTKIVAINLGVLSRFLNETSVSFSQLSLFVRAKGILENRAVAHHYYEESFFQFINLADYKLFSLNKEGAASTLLETLFEKITELDNSNPFYKAFNDFYSDHPYRDNCVIRFNYLQLSKKDVQKALINLIIYAIVKFKLIVSIRDLLNFIYDIIVPYPYQQQSSESLKSLKDYSDFYFSLKHSLYNKLFDSEGRSSLLSAIKKLDPLSLRSEKLDNLIFQLSSSEYTISYFKSQNIDLNVWRSDSFDSAEKRELVKTFVRSLYMNNLNEFNLDLEDFYAYARYLYAYHTGNVSTLKTLYKIAIKAIHTWNGNARSENEITVPIGKHQLSYNISQNILISPTSIKVLASRECKELYDFDTSIIVDITAGSVNNSFTLDFNLYKLLKKVVHGYHPNKFDRDEHIDFQKFVDTIISEASKDVKSINIEKINGSIRKRYQLSFKNAFGYEFTTN